MLFVITIPHHSVSCILPWHVGIEGAFDGVGAKTVIPRKVIGKFSIRLVPDMLPDQVEKLVSDHIDKLHKASGSPNNVK